LKTQIFTLTTDIEYLTTADYTFFCAPHLDKQFLELIVKAKIDLIQSIKQDFSNLQLKEGIIKIVKNTMHPGIDVIGEKILKLLSENKLSDYINKWYTTRMAIIENFKNVTHH